MDCYPSGQWGYRGGQVSQYPDLNIQAKKSSCLPDCQDSYAKGGSEASTDGDILQLDILHKSCLIKGFG